MAAIQYHGADIHPWKKVREVAMRLALSESDYYRKQRIALKT
jgi:hypothetical protein